jgi:hypothetical protein
VRSAYPVRALHNSTGRCSPAAGQCAVLYPRGIKFGVVPPMLAPPKLQAAWPYRLQHGIPPRSFDSPCG